jgi:tetratricopeptide (TPR) repeat protein
MSPDGISSYEEFRFLARSEGNWRALYDSALFAVLVSGELGEAARQFPGGGAEFDPGLVEPAVLSILEQASRRADIADTPLYDRLVTLVRSRNDLEETVRKLRSRGRSGRILGAKARKSLELKSSGLLEQALEDLDTAISGSRSISDTDLSEIYYLQAFALKQLGRHEEAVIRARSAVERDPDNARASELIENTNEVSS